MTTSPHADLDDVLSRARHLLLDYDGPVRDPSGQPAAYLEEALTACRESGRTAAIIAATAPKAVASYLQEHDLEGLARYTTARSIPAVSTEMLRRAVSDLATSAGECVIITASPAAILNANNVGLLTIGYATGTDIAAQIIDADALLPSLADLTLRLRARPLPN